MRGISHTFQRFVSSPAKSITPRSQEEAKTLSFTQCSQYFIILWKSGHFESSAFAASSYQINPLKKLRRNSRSTGISVAKISTCLRTFLKKEGCREGAQCMQIREFNSSIIVDLVGFTFVYDKRENQVYVLFFTEHRTMHQKCQVRGGEIGTNFASILLTCMFSLLAETVLLWAILSWLPSLAYRLLEQYVGQEQASGLQSICLGFFFSRPFVIRI